MRRSERIISRPVRAGVAELQCPRCQSYLLHHGLVTVYDRSEDEATVVKTVVSNGKVTVDPLASNEGNPSSRRDGLVVSFWCEGCGEAPLYLTIAQHRGATEIGWLFADPE